MNANEQGTFVPGALAAEPAPTGDVPALETDDFMPDPALDPLADGGSERRLSGGSALIIAVVLIAVAGLFSMKKLAEVTAVTGIDREIELTIEKFLTPLRSDDSKTTDGWPGASDTVMIAVLNETYSERQIPLRDIQRDPFVIESEQPVTAATLQLSPNKNTTADRLAQIEKRKKELHDQRERELLDLCEAFRLTAILGGSRPVATIDGKTVRVGQTLTAGRNDDEFRVEEIGLGVVTLVSEVPELDLTVRVDVKLYRSGR